MSNPFDFPSAPVFRPPPPPPPPPVPPPSFSIFSPSLPPKRPTPSPPFPFKKPPFSSSSSSSYHSYKSSKTPYLPPLPPPKGVPPPDLSFTAKTLEDLIGTNLFSKLKSHQVECLVWVVQRHGVGMVALDRGLGKTLTMICILLIYPQHLPALVITTGTVCLTILSEVLQWSAEAKEAFLPEDVIVLTKRETLQQEARKKHMEAMKAWKIAVKEQQKAEARRKADEKKRQAKESRKRKASSSPPRRNIQPIPEQVDPNDEDDIPLFAYIPKESFSIRLDGQGGVRSPLHPSANITEGGEGGAPPPPLPSGTPGKLIYIISHDQMKVQLQWILEQKFEMVMIDEAHKCKKVVPVPTELFESAQAIMKNAKIRILCSGTPISASHLDIYGPSLLIQPTLFPDYETFVKYFCEETSRATDWNGTEEIPGGFKNKDMLHAFLAEHFWFRRSLFNDGTVLPLLHRTLHYIHLPTKYRDKCMELRAAWKAKQEEMKVLSQQNKANMRAGLVVRDANLSKKDRQGAIRHDAEAEYVAATKYLAVVKRKAVMESLMQDLQEVLEEGRKALVWGHTTVTMNRLKERMSKEGIPSIYITGEILKQEDRNAEKEKFQDPSLPYKLALLSYMACSEGLTLVEGNYCFCVELINDPKVAEQGEARIWRMGQKRECFIKYYVVKDSVDEDIINTQRRKIIHSAHVMDNRIIKPSDWATSIHMKRPPEMDVEDEKVDKKGHKKVDWDEVEQELIRIKEEEEAPPSVSSSSSKAPPRKKQRLQARSKPTYISSV